MDDFCLHATNHRAKKLQEYIDLNFSHGEHCGTLMCQLVLVLPHSIHNCTELRSFNDTRSKIVKESISGVAEYLIKIV